MFVVNVSFVSAKLAIFSNDFLYAVRGYHGARQREAFIEGSDSPW